MDTKVNYAKVTKRVAACVVDQMIFYLIFSLLLLFTLNRSPYADLSNADLFDAIFSYTTFMSVQDEVLGALMSTVLEALMITKLGWTPGKFLCGICIKDANKIKNATLMQAVIRSSFKVFLWVPSYISEWLLVLPILALLLAIFDQRKQFFYDKIAKTVVIDYKPEKHHLNLNYVGITRRVVAYIIDRFIITGISLVFFYFAEMTFDPVRAELLDTCLSFLLPIVFGVYMIRRFSGTPGQLLCSIHIKDANTLGNITLMQATIRCVLFEVTTLILDSIFTMNIFFDSLGKYTSKWWFDPLTDLTFTTIILIFIFAIFDKRKQFFHDKIAKTVAIYHKSSR
jgi:uncharacterized RDD family membrane protein YckC